MQQITHTDWINVKNAPWYPSLSNGGYVAYRIWAKLEGSVCLQRHEWKGADGSIEMEDWIYSRISFHDFAKECSEG